MVSIDLAFFSQQAGKKVLLEKERKNLCWPSSGFLITLYYRNYFCFKYLKYNLLMMEGIFKTLNLEAPYFPQNNIVRAASVQAWPSMCSLHALFALC